MAKASGGFDPDRLIESRRTEPIIGRIIAHDLESERDPNMERPDDRSLLRTVRDLVARFDELSDENADLRETNLLLEADLKKAQQELAALRQSLSALSEASRSAVATATEMLERAEGAVESRLGGTQAEIDGRFETAIKRALELRMTAVLMLEEAREASARRAREADQETLSLLREGKQSLLAAAENLYRHTQEPGNPPVAPSPEEGAEKRSQDAPVQETATGAGLAEAEPVQVPAQAAEPAAEAEPVQVPAQAAEPAAEAVKPAEVDMPEPRAESLPPDIVELIVVPFCELGSLDSLLRAVSQSPEVVEVKPGGFEGGKFRVKLRYRAPVSPLTPLLALSGFNVRLMTIDANRVEVALLGAEAASS